MGHRCNSDPKLLWLWCRLAAPAPIQLLAQDLPYARVVALKSKSKNKTKTNKQTNKQTKQREKRKKYRSPHCGSLGYVPDIVSVKLQVQSLALPTGLRIWCCSKLCYRLQMHLRSQVAVDVVWPSSCSSSSTPSLGNSICHRYDRK